MQYLDGENTTDDAWWRESGSWWDWTGSSECFLVDKIHRDHHVLIPIIKQHVRSRTLIITDGWKGYLPITTHGHLHEDVNHSQNFVIPSTGSHTNTIEGCWFHVKRHLQRGIGWLWNDPDTFVLNLAKFMWKKRHSISSSPDDCKIYLFVEFPRLMKKIFSV